MKATNEIFARKTLPLVNLFVCSVVLIIDVFNLTTFYSCDYRNFVPYPNPAVDNVDSRHFISLVNSLKQRYCNGFGVRKNQMVPVV